MRKEGMALPIGDSELAELAWLLDVPSFTGGYTIDLQPSSPAHERIVGVDVEEAGLQSGIVEKLKQLINQGETHVTLRYKNQDTKVDLHEFIHTILNHVLSEEELKEVLNGTVLTITKNNLPVFDVMQNLYGDMYGDNIADAELLKEFIANYLSGTMGVFDEVGYNEELGNYLIGTVGLPYWDGDSETVKFKTDRFREYYKDPIITEGQTMDILNTREDTGERDLGGEIINFIKENPNPEDEAVHSFAEELGMEADTLEERFYSLMSEFFAAGRYNENPVEVDEEQLKMGIEVEMEHTTNPEIAKRISLDHLSEFPDYYTRLKKMEEDGKRELNMEGKEKESMVVAKKEPIVKPYGTPLKKKKTKKKAILYSLANEIVEGMELEDSINNVLRL